MQSLTAIAKHYEEIVTSMTDSPTIVYTALKLAYYSAMLDAALDDPMDDPVDQTEVLANYRLEIKNATESFQQLVNEKL